MKEETVQVRVYKSDHEFLLAEADKMDTTVARIVHEALQAKEVADTNGWTG